jgi:tetraacyldisaccharide 4'-kinase
MAVLSAETYRAIVSGQQTGLTATALRGLLAAGEPLYAAVVARKNRQFDSGRRKPARVATPVISVGNLTVGGTGKTPFVVWLARWFLAHNRPVTLISRGYGQQHGPNDEAREIAASLPDVPHLQNPDRVAAAREALRQSPNHVLILDDAFQHRRMARDLDIVLLDALEPFGYDHLLPRGLLREPITSLARAHVVALSRSDAVSPARRLEIRAQVARHAPQAIWLELTHAPQAMLDFEGREEPISAWQGRPLAAFCGIGNPAGFEHTLATCGLNVKAFRPLADHQAYDEATIRSLTAWLKTCLQPGAGLAGVVCTHKDLVKLPQALLAGLPLRCLKVALQMRTGQTEFEQRLRTLVD